MSDEHDGPKSPDPGNNAGSRARWGTQILQAFAALQSSVADLGRTAKTSSEELAGLGKKVDVLEKIREDFDKFETTATVEVGYLKAWSKWALGTAITLILGLMATAASVLTNQNAMLANDANMTKTMEKFDKTAMDLNGKFDRTAGELDKTVKDLSKTVGELDKTVAGLGAKLGDLNTNVGDMKGALGDFLRSLDDFIPESR